MEFVAKQKSNSEQLKKQFTFLFVMEDEANLFPPISQIKSINCVSFFLQFESAVTQSVNTFWSSLRAF